jgi:hypothetical protein
VCGQKLFSGLPHQVRTVIQEDIYVSLRKEISLEHNVGIKDLKIR